MIPHPLRRYLELRPFTPKSLVLVMLGLIYVLIGVNAMLEEWSPYAREALFMLDALGTRMFWGGVSIAGGLLAVASSRWPSMNDSWGFVALAVLGMWWACAYTLGTLTTALAGKAVVAGVAASGMLTWLGMCVLLWAISRLEDPVVEDQHSDERLSLEDLGGGHE